MYTRLVIIAILVGLLVYFLVKVFKNKSSKFEPSEADIALQVLISSEDDLNVYYSYLESKGFTQEQAARLYNLILIACGRQLLTSGVASPSLPDHYLLNGSEKVLFESCEVYKQVVNAINLRSKEEITFLGSGSCEVQAFNDVLNKLEAKLGRPPEGKDIELIELYPPEMPC